MINTKQFNSRPNDSLISSVNCFLRGTAEINDYYRSMIAALVERGLDHRIDPDLMPELQKLSGGSVNPNGKWVPSMYRVEDSFKIEWNNGNKYNTDGRIYIDEIVYDEKTSNTDNEKYEDVILRQVLGRMIMVFVSNNVKPYLISIYKSTASNKWVFHPSWTLPKNVKSYIRNGVDMMTIFNGTDGRVKFDLSIELHDAIKMYMQYINDPSSISIKKTVRDWINDNFVNSFDLNEVTFASYVGLLSTMLDKEIDVIHNSTDEGFVNPLSYSNVSQYIEIDNFYLGIYIDSNKNKKITFRKMENQPQ